MGSTGLPQADLDVLRRLWCDALELTGEWSEDATFLELGGYSLLALSLADTIGAELDLPVSKTVIFEQPTFGQLSAWLGQLTASNRTSGQPAAPATNGQPRLDDDGRSFPMSALQQAYLLGETGGFELACPAAFVEEYRIAEFDLAAFEAAVDVLLQRHGMLRSVFDRNGQQQVVASPDRPIVELRDLAESAATEVESELAASRDDLTRSVPLPGSGTVLRFRVFRIPDGYHIQVWGRLLAFDGRSLDVFVDELSALLSGEPIPDLGYTFGDYQRELDRRRESEEYAASRQYWTDRLFSLPPAPELPYRWGDADSAAHRMTRRTMQLDGEAWLAFKTGAAAHGLTTTMALCAAFCEVLRHYSSAPDFTINVMYGERVPLHADTPRVIGNFSDTLLLECASGGEDTFAARAKAVGTQLVADLAHGAYSGVDTIRGLNSSRGGAHGVAMPVVFTSVVGGPSQNGIFFERLGWTRVGGGIHTPQVSLDQQVFDAKGSLFANWDSVDEMFPPGMVEAMVASYRELINRLCADPGAWQERVLVHAPADALAVRAQVNDTAAPIQPRTLHGPFFAWARQTPDAVAVIAPGCEITYRELAGRATRLAAHLRDAGCRPGDLVLVHQDRGLGQVVAVLGVLAAGAAYVPLGFDWPAIRTSQVVARSKARYLVSDHDGELSWAAGLQRITIDDAGALAPEPATAHADVDPEALAYVIFTSGTTGEPKGVMIRHASAANTIDDLIGRFAIGPADRVLAISELTFDLSVFDILGPLATGGAVVVPQPARARDIAALHALCASAGVTIWNSVPAYLGMLVDYRETATRADLPALRLAMVSGDWVPVDLGGRLIATLPHTRLVSLGGATEASIWSNWYPVPDPVPPEWASIPYGYPLANQHFRVLDAAMSDRPDWVSGDLYIGGRGLADGYLNDPDLTKAAFVQHPADGSSLYRTGDRACYWPDGTVEFLGRQDGQVKVNGFRVEVSEVEAALLAEPDIRAAAVVLHRDDRGGSLVGHVVKSGDRGEAEILTALADRLPDYLIPRLLLTHEALPLTTNGKVDRATLAAAAPAAPAGSPTSGPVAPISPTEDTMLRLWRAVVPVAGVTDDFFAAGGHSLSAASLMNAIEQEFGVRLPLTQLYRFRTVRELSGALGQPASAGSTLTHLGGDGEPVVLIHPVGGDLLCYLPLVEALGDTFALHGIAGGAQVGDDQTVTDLAASYLRLVTERFGEARVGIVGWSFGALVGYEMARMSGRAHPLVMLDPWLPARAGYVASEEELKRSFAYDISAGRHDDTDELDIGGNALAAMFGTYRNNATTLLRYQFVSDQRLAPTIVTADQGFGAERPNHLVPIRSVVDATMLPRAQWHPLVGDHFSVVEPSRTAEVAELVRRGLRGPGR